MAVNIDKTWGDRQPTRIDDALGGHFVFLQPADFHNLIPFDGDISGKPQLAGSIYHIAVANDEIEPCLRFLPATGQQTRLNDKQRTAHICFEVT